MEIVRKAVNAGVWEDMDNMTKRRESKEISVKERVYYEPDEDFYRSISADEFKEKALEIVRKVHNLYYPPK